MVLNPLAWQRTDLVEANVQMPDGPKDGIQSWIRKAMRCRCKFFRAMPATNSYELLIEAKDIPSIGLRNSARRAWEARKCQRSKTSGLTLENESLRVTVDARAAASRAYSTRGPNLKRIASGGCGNELQAFKDTPKEYDAWNIDADFEKDFTEFDKADSVQVDRARPVARRRFE